MTDYRRQRSELAAALKEWANASEAYVTAFDRFRSSSAKVADAAEAIGLHAWHEAAMRTLAGIREVAKQATPEAMAAIKVGAGHARRGAVSLPLTPDDVTKENAFAASEAERLGLKPL